MKLRFRENSLRLRVNRKEVEKLAAGQELAESVHFGSASLNYLLTPTSGTQSTADFDGKRIRVAASLADWAQGEEIGFYFEVEPKLRVAIEKDLECVDGPENEKDPDAFPRGEKQC